MNHGITACRRQGNSWWSEEKGEEEMKVVNPETPRLGLLLIIIALTVTGAVVSQTLAA